jgi:wobble nucleotide-excising tRNase
MNELNSPEHWDVIKEAMLAKSESILGLSHRKHFEDWITEETWNEIKTPKTTKQKINITDEKTRPILLAEYSDTNNHVKMYARRDKKAWADKLDHNAQLAAEKNNSRELYQITKWLAAKPFICNQVGIRHATGRLLPTLQDQLTR